MTPQASIGMLPASAVVTDRQAPTGRLDGVRILLVAPSLGILGGQAVQADLLLHHLRSEGVAVNFQPHNPVPWWPLNYLTRIKYLRTLIVSIFYLGGLLRRIPRHDVIHIFSASYMSFMLAPAPAILLSRLFGKKCILNYRSGEADDHLTRWRRRIGWILRRVDKIIVPSGYLVAVFAHHGYTATAIPNIADAGKFCFRQRREVLPRILVPRNLEPLYDVETAIRAFVEVRRHYPSATLRITGTGSEELRLRRLVREEKLEGIEFVGRIERDRMPRLYDEADIFLNTSVVDNMPVAIIEAFFSGLPVVTTNAGGIPYIVRDRENGLLCEMRDHKALAAAVCELVANADLRHGLAAAGQSDTAAYRWESVRQRWADTYLNLVRNS